MAEHGRTDAHTIEPQIALRHCAGLHPGATFQIEGIHLNSFSKDKIIKISRPVSSIVGMPSGSQDPKKTTQNIGARKPFFCLCWMLLVMFAFFVGYTIHIYSHVIYIDFWLVQIKSSLPTVAERDTSPKTR